MNKRRTNIILGILGGIVLVIVVLVAGSAWLITSVLHRQDADEISAKAAFEAARARFKGATPVFELGPNGPVLARPVPAAAPATTLHTMHVLIWEPDEQRLTRADVPLALLRLTDSKIDFFQFTEAPKGLSRRQQVGRIRLSELERFGPALLADNEVEPGRPILVWTD
jgi:hypothetical protein